MNLEHLPSPTVTAAVCTRNRGERIVDTVDSLISSDHSAFEVLVLDQSSDDITETALTPYLANPRFRYVRLLSVGVGRARTEALSIARGELVAFTDDDCVVPPEWLTIMEEIFAVYPRVAMAFCNVLPAPHDATAGFVPTYVREGELLARNVRDKCTARGIGAGMAVRRQAALDVGGFDGLLGPGGRFPANEEGDLALRLLLKGWRLFETDRVAVIHDGFRTWAEGSELTKRNWLGIGAAYAKPVRCGFRSAWIVVLYEGIIQALVTPLTALFRLRFPRGLRRALYFWRGFAAAWQHPLDCRNVTFKDMASDAAPTTALKSGQRV